MKLISLVIFLQFIYLFIYLFMAVLGLRFCVRAFSSCGKRGPLFIAVHGPLTIAASLVAEHRLQTCRLSNCGSQAQLLCGMWDLPRPGLEPVCPALTGRFSTTAPPGKPCVIILESHLTSLNFTCTMGLMMRLLQGLNKIRYVKKVSSVPDIQQTPHHVLSLCSFLPFFFLKPSSSGKLQ